MQAYSTPLLKKVLGNSLAPIGVRLYRQMMSTWQNVAQSSKWWQSLTPMPFSIRFSRRPWGQALPPGNVLFLPFDPKTFIWIRPDPERRAKPWSELILTRWGKSNVFLNRIAWAFLQWSPRLIPKTYALAMNYNAYGDASNERCSLWIKNFLIRWNYVFCLKGNL